MVLVPGAAVLGRDEPRLKALARTFARAGFVGAGAGVARRAPAGLSRADADRVATAMRHCGMREPGVPLGVAAVSYAVAPAIIAVLQEDLASRVGFVVGIGGYRDAEAASASSPPAAFARAATAASTGVNPTATARWAFLVANAGRLDNPGDAYILEEIGQLRFHDRDADISRQAAELGPRGVPCWRSSRIAIRTR